jgi:hypothetical protein
MTETVIGVFDTWEEASAAVERLRSAGFTEDHVNVLARSHAHPEAHRFFHPGGRETAGEAVEDAAAAAGIPTNENTAPTGGAVMGAALGAIVGGIGGLTLAMSLVAIPLLGPVLIGGSILTSVVGSVAGASVGSVLGAMAGMRLSETDAADYERALEEGKVLVGVSTAGRETEARSVLEDAGARWVREREEEREWMSTDNATPRSWNPDAVPAEAFQPDVMSGQGVLSPAPVAGEFPDRPDMYENEMPNVRSDANAVAGVSGGLRPTDQSLENQATTDWTAPPSDQEFVQPLGYEGVARATGDLDPRNADMSTHAAQPPSRTLPTTSPVTSGVSGETALPRHDLEDEGVPTEEWHDEDEASSAGATRA